MSLIGADSYLLMDYLSTSFRELSKNNHQTSLNLPRLPLDILNEIFTFCVTPFCDPASGKPLDKVTQLLKRFDLAEKIAACWGFWETEKIPMHSRSIFVNEKVLQSFIENYKYEKKEEISLNSKKEKLFFIKNLSNKYFEPNHKNYYLYHNNLSKYYCFTNFYNSNRNEIKEIFFEKEYLGDDVLNIKIIYQSNKKFQFRLFDIGNAVHKMTCLKKINELCQKELEEKIISFSYKKEFLTPISFSNILLEKEIKSCKIIIIKDFKYCPIKLPFLPMCEKLVISNLHCRTIEIKKMKKNEKTQKTISKAIIDCNKIRNINNIEIYNNNCLRHLKIDCYLNNCKKIKIYSNDYLEKIIFNENSINNCIEFSLSIYYLEKSKIVFPKLSQCEYFSSNCNSINIENLYNLFISLKKCKKFNLNFDLFLEMSELSIQFPFCEEIHTKINKKKFTSKKLIKQIKLIIKIFPNLKKLNLLHSFIPTTTGEARLFAIIYQKIITAFPNIQFINENTSFEENMKDMKNWKIQKIETIEIGVNPSDQEDDIYS